MYISGVLVAICAAAAGDPAGVVGSAAASTANETSALYVKRSVSPFSPWSECTATCGVGSKKRIRDILQQPAMGSAKCPHTMGIRNCNIHPCPAAPEVPVSPAAVTAAGGSAPPTMLSAPPALPLVASAVAPAEEAPPVKIVKKHGKKKLPSIDDFKESC